jgi:hypothetical protein
MLRKLQEKFPGKINFLHAILEGCQFWLFWQPTE